MTTKSTMNNPDRPISKELSQQSGQKGRNTESAQQNQKSTPVNKQSSTSVDLDHNIRQKGRQLNDPLEKQH